MTLEDMVIVIDTSEQHMFFKRPEKGLIIVRDNLKPQGGDYSVKGFEDEIIIERKSPEDFCNSITNNRETFYKTFPKIRSHTVGIIVVEQELSWILPRCNKDIGKRRKKGSKIQANKGSGKDFNVHPNVVTGFYTSSIAKHGIPVFFLPGRVAAEQFTLGVLRKYYEFKRG